MPESTTRPPLDIAKAREHLNLCGSCDAGLPMGCTCPSGDIRAVLMDALDELEQRRAGADRVRAAHAELVHREREHSGHGRTGHLAEDDLSLILDALAVPAQTTQEGEDR